MTTISVIMAAYKGEKFIGDQLRSLFRQTRLPDEILIGDDSPDNATCAAIESVLPEAPPSIKIDYAKNQERLGFLANFSNLTAKANGDFIFFCDQDDIWLPEKIQILSEELENHPDKDLVFCDSMRVNENLQPLERLVNRKNIKQVKRDLETGCAFKHFWFMQFPLSAHNIAIRRTQNNQLLPFPPTIVFHDVWMCSFFSVQEKILYIDKILTLYRIHGENISTPKAHGHGKNFLERIAEICGDPVPELTASIANLQNFRSHILARVTKQHIPERNMKLMDMCIAFTEWRLNNAKASRAHRILSILSHSRDYFLYAFGIRSILRDLLSSEIRKRQDQRA